MSLLTVERSPSVEGYLSSSSEDEAGDEIDDESGEHVEHHPPKFGRMRSPSFAGYFASKGGAVSLPDGNKARTPTRSHRSPCVELQNHLQSMIMLLREEDSLKMAVRIESQLPDKKRYLTAVTNPSDECILVGIDWASGPTIGLVLELKTTTLTKLDGDGGFHITYESGRTHCFKPVSVQTLWSAMHIIDRGKAIAAKNSQSESYAELMKFYRSKISSDPTSISEWNMMDDLMSTRQFDLVTSDAEDPEVAAVKKIIRSKLKEVMIRVDIDIVTSREIRRMCEDELGMDLSEFKSFLDQEMFTILGQMDSASKIFDYLYLGSEWNASDYEELQNLGIGYILNLTREIDNFFPDTFHYYNVRVWDEEDTELLQYWDGTYKFIHNAKMAGSRVLVHCRRGISRSASSVIAYIMKSRGWSLKESMEYVKNCRSIVDPNAGFQKQLIIYEGILNSSRNRYSTLFRQRSKSDVISTLYERRQQFKKAKQSYEIDEEEAGNEAEAGRNEAEQKTPNRPKSWTADSSINFDATVDPERFVSRVTSKSIEMPTLTEAVEEDATAKSGGDSRRKVEREKSELSEEVHSNDGPGPNMNGGEKRRHLSRARTLPTPTARHWEALAQKETKIDDSAPLTEAEETKQENLVEQALAASIMKRQLLQSLVKLQELRGTKDVLDNQFSVESIIKPSSLRKAAFSRRLPYERTRSFSDDKDPGPRPFLRERAFTVGPSRYFSSYDDIDDEVIANSEEGTGTDEDKQEYEPVETCMDTTGAESFKEEASLASLGANQQADAEDTEPSIIKTSQFQTVKESAKHYEQLEKLRTQRIRILRSPRRHTIGGREVWEKGIKEVPSSTRSRSSEGRVAHRNQSPSPETICKGKKARKENVCGNQLLTVCNVGEDSLGHLDEPAVEGVESNELHEITDDLSVRKLVEKHSNLIRNSSPPSSSALEPSFFNLNSEASLIGENLISNSAADVDNSQSETSEKIPEKEIASNNNEHCIKQGTQSGYPCPPDVVQIGIVKRQSKLFSQLDVDQWKENQEESLEEEGAGRSQRGSVKELLRQMEGKSALATQHPPVQRPLTPSSDKQDMELDTEVEAFMRSSEKSSAEVEDSEQMLLKPQSGDARTKSAPSSPKLPRDDVARGTRSSSLGSKTQFDELSKCSSEALSSVQPSEATAEDVKSLVDRFEEGNLSQ